MPDHKNSSQTEASEVQIARLTVLADTRYLPVITDMITDIAKAAGVDEESARNLDAVLEEVFQKILDYGYEGDTTQSIEVVVSRRAHSLVVAVEDKGLPFDCQGLEQGEDLRFSYLLSKGYADQIHFLNLGPSGNRVELVRDLPATDIRDQLDLAEHHALLEAKEAHTEEALTTRMMHSDEAIALARLVYRCYGYTYPSEFVYYPEQIEARQKAGLMKSCAVYNSHGEMVGHLALSLDRPGAKVAESGQAVVDPRYRGYGLFERMKTHLRDYAATNRIIGIYSEAVTVHSYSQKGNLALGAHEVGFLLGYSPGTISFHRIADQEKPRRQSIALMYTPVLKSALVPVFPPEAYRAILEQIYEMSGIHRRISAEQAASTYQLPPTGHLAVSVRPDLNQAFLTVEACGCNTLDAIRFHLNQLCLNRIDCIYADFSLSQEGTRASGDKSSKSRLLFWRCHSGIQRWRCAPTSVLEQCRNLSR